MTWRPEVVVVLVTLAALYLTGWTRLALRAPRRQRPRLLARLALALGGLVTLAVALLGLHRAAHELFVVHMSQHLLLVMVAVPALLLADPFPAVVWALPGPARRWLGPHLTRVAAPRRWWAVLTRLPVAFVLHAAALWLWHLPVAWNAALADGLLHDVEHLAFATTAVLFWWPVLEPAPRARRAPVGGRIVYLVLAAFQSGALGVLLALSPIALYDYGGGAGLTPLEDQAWGGVLMWGAGGAIDMLAVLVLVWRFLGGAERGRYLDRNGPLRENQSV